MQNEEASFEICNIAKQQISVKSYNHEIPESFEIRS